MSRQSDNVLGEGGEPPVNDALGESGEPPVRCDIAPGKFPLRPQFQLLRFRSGGRPLRRAGLPAAARLHRHVRDAARSSTESRPPAAEEVKGLHFGV